MGKFLKYLLASFIGCLLALFIIFIIMIGIIGGLASMGDQPVTVSKNSVLRIDLSQEVTEQASESFSMRYGPSPTMGLNRILDALKRAKDDDNIKGVFLNTTAIPAGLSLVEEIRAALADFKASGKFIIAYSDIYTQKSYYLCSVADKVYVSPLGDFAWHGMSASTPFIKKALEKLDIDMQIIRHGKFKSAVEPLILDKMSAESREQAQIYVNAVWNEVVTTISKARNISVAKLNALADDLTLVDASAGVHEGLFDGSVYYDAVLDELAEKSEAASANDVKFISLPKYIKYCKAHPPVITGKKPKIAVIYAEGDIVTGEGSERGTITSEGLAGAIREARCDTTVKAIVLRINSGGGSALASDVISREVSLADDIKPVIASMSSVAASGGYYIAVMAKTILADRTTITGSIGVFSVVPNLEKFMDKKLGITFDEVNTNKHADYISVMRPLTPEEQTVMQRNVEKIYDTFLVRVSEGRSIPKSMVDDMGQGRVWSAIDAKKIGLIDDFGGLNDAITLAAERAGITDYRITELPRQPSMLESLMTSFSDEMSTRALRAEMGDAYRYYRQLKSLKSMQGAQMRMLFDIEIK